MRANADVLDAHILIVDDRGPNVLLLCVREGDCLAQKILHTVAKTFDLQGHSDDTSMSVGTVVFQEMLEPVGEFEFFYQIQVDTRGLAVNIGACQVAQADFAAGVAQLRQDAGACAQRLTLELTERTLDADVGDVTTKMHAIRALGISLGLPVIAEGVETAAQREFFAALGCSCFQGNDIGAVAPVAERVDFYMKNWPVALI